MKRIVLFSCLIFSLCWSSLLFAEHGCDRPTRPDARNRVLMNEFKDAVEVYRVCISKHIKEENEKAEAAQKIMDKHRDAAQRAMNEWNDFVAKQMKKGP